MPRKVIFEQKYFLSFHLEYVFHKTSKSCTFQLYVMSFIEILQTNIAFQLLLEMLLNILKYTESIFDKQINKGIHLI